MTDEETTIQLRQAERFRKWLKERPPLPEASFVLPWTLVFKSGRVYPKGMVLTTRPRSGVDE